MSASIHDMEPGDYVKGIEGSFFKIKSIYGVNNGRVAKPSEGGFGIITEDGRNISMWQAGSYHKAKDIDHE